MTQRTILAALLAVTGILLSVPGVIFIAGSGIIASRLITGCVMTATGALSLAGGIVLFRRGTRGRQTGIRNKLLRMGKLELGKCPHCGNNYPVHDDIERCPSCGGDLKAERTLLAEGGMKRSMDDDSGVG